MAYTLQSRQPGTLYNRFLTEPVLNLDIKKKGSYGAFVSVNTVQIKMKYYCNPINVTYRYQFNKDIHAYGKLQIDREAADPSMIQFQGKYYIFASMNLSVWVSEDMVNWEMYRLPDNLPLYDYAPDVRVRGEYVYFSASRKGENCSYYRTRDIVKGPYEKITGTFDFWDPNLFFDDDGRVYFYWGCSNITPIWGVELDQETLLPKTERIELLSGNGCERGYERVGVDHCELSKDPFIEGPWMDKYEGKYYLQYACPGAEFNVYADGVYVADAPLGPFKLAENNPFSYHPGGFMPGAGHGSTMWDKRGNLWHASTMRISVNHRFERRVGIWPAGFDQDGELFCNQNYGDWPIAVDERKSDPWREPQWYLLSYAKTASASSCEEGKEAGWAVNEDAQSWWRAKRAESGQWLMVDLEKNMDVRAIQINFADDELSIDSPGQIQGAPTQPRYIEERDLITRWKLESSVDGEEYFVIEDKSLAVSDLPHDFIVREEGIKARYIRLTIMEVPYGAAPCISGLRVFGIGVGDKPEIPFFQTVRSGDGLDFLAEIEGSKDAVGYNILWGHTEDKLYHSYQIYRSVEDVRAGMETMIYKRIGALVKSQEYYVRVDAYNENGITRGRVVKLTGRSEGK